MHIAHPAHFLGSLLDGRYRIDRLLGEGGSAWVFSAKDLRLDRDVAIKVLKPRFAEEDRKRRKRFLAEARTLAQLVHPHIVSVHDAHEAQDGLLYLVMELSASGSLEQELETCGCIELPETLQLLMPLMGALACAHDRGILHRDIKPANIAVVRQAERIDAKLLDFGIAKRSDSPGTTDGVIGTPSYMAPEQARGEPLSPASDVWALGVVFFRCLTGRLPFDAHAASQVLIKLQQERAPLFADACEDLPSQVAAALDRALEQDPARRYADMRSFARSVALAVQRSGIPVPRSLDPVGLPQLDRWLEAADAETTRELPSGSHRIRSAAWRRAGRFRLGAIILIALAALCIARAAQLWARPYESARRGHVRDMPVVAEGSQGRSPVVGHTVAPDSLMMAATKSPTLTPEPIASTEPARSRHPQRPPKRQAKGKPVAQAGDRTQAPSTNASATLVAEPPEQPTLESPELIRNWNWQVRR